MAFSSIRSFERTQSDEFDRRNFVILCVRIPKTGSKSLETAVSAAFAGTRRFYVPNTLDLDGRQSPVQRLRFRRGQARNLLAHYGTSNLERVFAYIDREARAGELLSGGHADFQTVRRKLSTPVRIVTILRNPYDRCRSEYHYARRNHLGKSALARIDSSAIPRIAAKYDFEGYLDFLLDQRGIYGNIAANYLGITPSDTIAGFFARHVFHAGVLERSGDFARILGQKLEQRVEFPHLNHTGSTTHVALGRASKRKIEILYERDFVIYEYVLNQADTSDTQDGTETDQVAAAHGFAGECRLPFAPAPMSNSFGLFPRP